jgi:cysteinyl-tRNA synthetase
MSWKHLGESFDIHGGGSDLIFPHHENEIAQSVCAFPGATFARYWIHNGMLQVDGEKMSKSLGNFLTVRDILKKGAWAGEAFRLLLLRTHYRQALDYTAAGLDEAKAELDDHYAMLARAGAAVADEDAARMVEWALEPLCDDLNTPLALARLRDLRTLANALTVGGSPNVVLERMGLREAPEIGSVIAAFREAADVLGLVQTDPAQWLQGGGDDAAAIETAIAARLAARKARNWAEADRIRDDLKVQGIILEDGAGGTSWKRA